MGHGSELGTSLKLQQTSGKEVMMPWNGTDNENKGRSIDLGNVQEIESVGLAEKLSLDRNGRQGIQDNPYISG